MALFPSLAIPDEARQPTIAVPKNERGLSPDAIKADRRRSEEYPSENESLSAWNTKDSFVDGADCRWRSMLTERVFAKSGAM